MTYLRARSTGMGDVKRIRKTFESELAQKEPFQKESPAAK